MKKSVSVFALVLQMAALGTAQPPGSQTKAKSALEVLGKANPKQIAITAEAWMKTEPAEALELWKFYLSKAGPTDPGYPRAYLLFAICLQQTGNHQGALKALREAQGLPQPDANRLEIYLCLAQFLMEEYRRGNDETKKAELYREASQNYLAAEKFRRVDDFPGPDRLAYALMLHEQRLAPDSEYFPAGEKILLLLSRLESALEEQAETIVMLRAETLERLRQFQDAAVAYSQFARKFPRSELVPDAVFGEANCRLQVKEYEKAIKLFLQLVNSSEKSRFHTESVFGLGQAHLALGELAEAQKNTQLSLREFAEAQKHFETCAQDAAFRYRDHSALQAAFCLAKENKFSEAAAQARTLLNSSVAAEARLLAAECSLRAGNFLGAIELLRRDAAGSDQLAPEEKGVLEQALQAEAEELFKQGLFEIAGAKFQSLAADLDNFSLKAVALQNSGKAWFRANKWPQAISVLEDANRIDEGTETNFYLALAYLETGQEARSQESIDRALILARVNGDLSFIADTLLQMAKVNEKRGRFGVAKGYYIRVLGEASATNLKQRIDAGEGLCRLALKARNFQEAAERLAATMVDQPVPNRGRINFLIGQCYQAAQKYSQALEYFDRTLAAAPVEWRARALLQSGRCLESLGKREEGLNRWYDLATRFPAHFEEVREAMSYLEEDLALQKIARRRRS